MYWMHSGIRIPVLKLILVGRQDCMSWIQIFKGWHWRMTASRTLFVISSSTEILLVSELWLWVWGLVVWRCHLSALQSMVITKQPQIGGEGQTSALVRLMLDADCSCAQFRNTMIRASCVHQLTSVSVNNIDWSPHCHSTFLVSSAYILRTSFIVRWPHISIQTLLRPWVSGLRWKNAPKSMVPYHSYPDHTSQPQ
jgi:hypothetical protein